MLKGEKHSRGGKGELGFSKLFQYNKFKYNINKK